MDGTNQPAIPKKGSSKMLLVGIVIAVVAIAAVAGAFLLMNNNAGKDNDNDNDNTNNNGNDNTNTGTTYELANGEFMVWDTDTTMGSISFNSTTKWVVSNVTASGYDVTIYSYSSTSGQTTIVTTHADYNDTLGASVDDSSGNLGTKVGTEQLSTGFGSKKVDHYRNTTVDETTTTTIDYYIGADTPVVYKMVMTITDSENTELNMTTTMEITDTNIDAVRNGND